MPFDANGKLLVVGDHVTIPAIVKTVTEDVNYVNCTVELEHPLPPTNAQITQSLNSKQVEKVGDGPAAGKPPEPAPAVAQPAKK